MNIVYLHSHDTGRGIQPHGYAVRTPALQTLAEQGCFFRDAHCAAPPAPPAGRRCSPDNPRTARAWWG